MITSAVTMTMIFLAVTAVVLALGMVVRDLAARHYNQLDRRLGLDDPQLDPASTVRQMEPESNRSNVDTLFLGLVDASGTPLDSATVLMLIVGSGIVACAAPLALMDNVLAAAGGLVLGISVPIIWLIVMRWRRISAMRKAMPEALQIVADTVRTGRNLEQAAEMVTTESDGPLSQEFQTAASRLKLGNSPVSVMENMARRVPLPEFRIFSTAVMVHRVAGGNLALLTERLAHAARDREEFAGHLSAVTAGSRLSAVGITLGSIVGVCLLAWFEPEYIGAFISHDLGPLLLLAAIAFHILGILWVWRVMRVNY